MTVQVWTIGHSSQSFLSLVESLDAHQITMVLDIRAYPRSARHPQFSRDLLSADLPREGIGYAWRGRDLGGFRGQPSARNPHLALSEGFAAYAEYMAGPCFRAAAAELACLAVPTALMCAERDWRSCHRSLISDFLTLRHEVEVLHILDAETSQQHRPHPAARIGASGDLVYDRGEQRQLF